MGGLKQGSVGKFSDFLALSINISKIVADTVKGTINVDFSAITVILTVILPVTVTVLPEVAVSR